MTGRELRAIRRRLRLSQEGFARLMGKHRNTIGRWEKSELPIEMTEELAIRAIEAGIRVRPRRRRGR